MVELARVSHENVKNGKRDRPLQAWSLRDIMAKRGEGMKKVKITAIRKSLYPDLMALYENPIEHACDVEEGMVFISENGERPENFCSSAWDSVGPFVKELAAGGGNFFDGWMKDPYSAMISCNDGFRPVSFYLKAMEDDI